MDSTVFLMLLLAAAMHAGWNAIVKGGRDKLLTTILVAGSAGLISALGLPFLPAPAPASWPYIATSGVLQIIYFVLVAQAYRLADMSQTYPLMRGTAPMLVALVSAFWLREHLPLLAWLGIGVICAGILGMVTTRLGGQGAGVLCALGNAVIIASYTLVDGAGARLSGAPISYTLWLLVVTGLPMTLWAIWRRRGAFTAYAARNWQAGLLGGVGTLTSYGVALWAMTRAPVAMVAALRETSILFGVLLSALVLHERVGRPRITGAIIIAAGAAILRLA